METVQLQCGHCQNLMAISVEHLGGQVQCPHCNSVVQTPPPAAKPPTPAAMELKERESIFGGAEATEDAIGGAAPKDRSREAKSSPRNDMPATAEFPAVPAGAAAAQSAETDLTTFKRRPLYDKSIIPLLGMIFLIPYAISTTSIIIYLLLTSQSRPHPFDMMRDPVPSKTKGGPRPSTQVIHSYPLAAHQITPIGKQIKIGDLFMIPEHVFLTPGGDLQLQRAARNGSKNTAFEPINDYYVRYSPSKEAEGDDGKPYTFLESKTKSVSSIFGGFLEYRKKVQGKEVPNSNTVLNPFEEAIIVLTTMDNYHKHVKTIADSKEDEPYLWRVQVRRGFVNIDGKDVSATAVFGVEFTSRDIERAAKKT